jgi:phenylacetate-coenzyme A ligase PaaK-like adenylate-forming protein
MKLSERVEVFRRARTELAGRRLTRDEIVADQEASLATLLRHAIASSPFHRDRLGRRASWRVNELPQIPVMRKEDLVASFESVVADRRLTLATLAEHAAAMHGEDPLLFEEFRVLTTGGTSGVTTYVPFDRASWLSVLAPPFSFSLERGFKPRLFPRRRVALISAGGPLHMTNRTAASNRSPVFAQLRLDVTTPLAQISAELDRFRPELISGYPSVIAALAAEQLAGKLNISPHLISCTSEQLTAGARTTIRKAWTEPFDIYSTTETGGMLAIECDAHEGLHLREDTCIVEVVDEEDRPVPDGERGSALLVTSWLNRTLPLIRYRIEDSVLVSSDPCPCGRATRRILELGGRREDTLKLPGIGGGMVPVHPNHFEEAIEKRQEVAQYQVVHRADAITVAIVERAGGGSEWTDELAGDLGARLRALGADPPPIRVELVEELSRPDTPGAKLRVVRSEFQPDKA